LRSCVRNFLLKWARNEKDLNLQKALYSETSESFLSPQGRTTSRSASQHEGPRSVSGQTVVQVLALGQVFLQTLQFYPVSNIPSIFPTHSFIHSFVHHFTYHRLYTTNMLAIVSFSNNVPTEFPLLPYFSGSALGVFRQEMYRPRPFVLSECQAHPILLDVNYPNNTWNMIALLMLLSTLPLLSLS